MGPKMSRVCQVTGKHVQYGNNVSHSHRKTRRRFLPNLHVKRFLLENGKKIKLLVSKKGLKIIEKRGIKTVLDQL
jgi:large subunit ribosomal protein L28